MQCKASKWDLSDEVSIFIFLKFFKDIYKFKSLTVNGDADEPHDVGYAYDYCVVQCPKIIEKILIYILQNIS